MCPSVKVSLNQLKHTQTHRRLRCHSHSPRYSIPSFGAPLVTIHLRSISDTLVCFSTSLPISLSPSLLSLSPLYLPPHPYSPFLFFIFAPPAASLNTVQHGARISLAMAVVAPLTGLGALLSVSPPSDVCLITAGQQLHN